MGGHRLLAEVECDQRVAGVQFQGLAYVLMRHRVVVCLVLHVVVDIDLDRLDVDVAVGVAGQRFERGLVELLERQATVTRQLLERLFVELIEQGTDTLIEFDQREEGVVAKAG